MIKKPPAKINGGRLWKNKEAILKQVVDKVGQLDDSQIFTQLLPFFPDQRFVKEFVGNYRSTLIEESGYILS